MALRLANYLSSGHRFGESEAHQAFRFRVLNYFMGVAVVFGLLIGALGELGVMVIGAVQSRTNFIYVVFNLVLIFWLRRDKASFHKIAWLQVISTFITFLVALLVVPNDEFRFVWFYVAVYIAYILLGVWAGISATVAAITVLVAANLLIDLHLSATAIYTSVFGLIVASLLSRAYSMQISIYEARLNKKNRELEENIRELDQTLERAYEASHTKSMFLAKMSHEIRTPMNGALSMVQVLKTTPLDEQQQSYLSSVERSGKTLLLLIDDLLDISRIESNNLELKSHAFRCWLFIEDILTQADPMFDSGELSFVADIIDNMPTYLIGDEIRLKQVIVNLLANAAKFTRHGEVRLVINGEHTHDQRYHLHIEVIDTGIGIPADKLATVFEPFRQLDPVRIANRGAGLGLPISMSIIEAMQGTLRVESELDKGSCFIVDVTLPYTEQGEVVVEDLPQELPHGRLRILLVDDDAISRLAVMTLLNKSGHDVVVAENGEEAITQLEHNTFDAILMDVHMPVMDGVNATRVIKARELTNAPVIGMTASVMNNERVGYLSAGMDALVEKPVNYQTLLHVIYSKIEQRYSA